MPASYHPISTFDTRPRRPSRRRRRHRTREVRPPKQKARKFRRQHHWGRIFLRVLTGLIVVGTVVAGFVIFRDMTEVDPIQIQVLGAEGRPLRGALVVTEDGREVSSVEGGIAAVPFEVPERLTVTADGYRPAYYDVATLPRQGPLALQMEPMVLQGRVTDSNGNGVVGATVTINDKVTETVAFGSFEVVEANPGTVVVEKAAWVGTSAEWGGERRRLDLKMDPFIVRGLRVDAATAGDDEAFARILDFADKSTVNALVFDTKIEKGNVTHEVIGYDEPQAIGSLIPAYDAAERLAQAKEHGLYAITRIVTFQDPYASLHRNDYAIHTADGSTWTTWDGLGWMDPTDAGSWEYPINLGVYACRMGFDEIQFDYVRFPTDGDLSDIVYDQPEATEGEHRVETIGGFLTEARRRINAEGCAVSADIFGIVMSVRNDQGIGQKVEELSAAVDALSPMIYPSHYGPGWMNLSNPNDHPYDVVGDALQSGMIRMEGGALLRPWLQGFAWDAHEVLASIDAAEDLHMGWLLWNQLSSFELEWLPPDNSR